MAADPGFWLGFAGIAATIISILTAVFLAFVGLRLQQKLEAQREVYSYAESIGETLYLLLTSGTFSVFPQGYDRDRLNKAFEKFVKELLSLSTADRQSTLDAFTRLLDAARGIGENLPASTIEISHGLASGRAARGWDSPAMARWLFEVGEVANECAWILQTRGDTLRNLIAIYASSQAGSVPFFAQGILIFFETMSRVHNTLHMLTREQRKADALSVAQSVPAWPLTIVATGTAFLLGVLLPLELALGNGSDIQTANIVVIGFFGFVLLAVVSPFVRPQAWAQHSLNLASRGTLRLVSNRLWRGIWERRLRSSPPSTPVEVLWACKNSRCRSFVGSQIQMTTANFGSNRIIGHGVQCNRCGLVGEYDSGNAIMAPLSWRQDLASGLLGLRRVSKS